jgi:hypothetical protein
MQGDFWFGQPLATEKQLPESSTEATFYYYNGTTTLFVSIDSGSSFKPVHTEFPSWNTPFFGVATPPRGSSAPGDLWAFAGWKLYHSINGGANFSSTWSFYHPSTTITVGALPHVTSARTGRDQSELAALCTRRGSINALKDGNPTLPVPVLVAPSSVSKELPAGERQQATAGYAVYVFGIQAYDQPTALYASIDFGHTWIQLSGGNVTAEEALGDSPTVLEASAKDVGVVYVGTGGRGLFERNVTAQLTTALLACEEAV